MSDDATQEGAGNITELRDVLFSTLRDLRSKESPLALDRATAINETAQTIINSVKVEVDFLKVTEQKGTGFIPNLQEAPPSFEAPSAKDLLGGKTTVKGEVTTHTMDD